MIKNYMLGAAFLLVGPSVLADSFRYQLQSKFHYRVSDENRFATSFPFPPEALPPGQSNAFLETVDAGDHLEASALTLSGIWLHDSGLKARFKIDAIDRYDRNPTSEDDKVDVDQFIVRYDVANSFSAGYIQVGKFAKFERQEERRTESYGVVATAFNRFEDTGFESGFKLESGLYGKLTWTTGNPVFFRDANALAGDNGTSDFREPLNNPNPELKSGIVLLYDAEVEGFDLGGEPELGLGLGYLWQTPDQSQSLDVLLFGYERELAKQQSLNGTFYGSDLDLFSLGEVVGDESVRLPAKGKDKQEYGVNLHWIQGDFVLFFQYVQQSLAEMERDGYELELSYLMDVGVDITPVIRYSELNNDFVGSPQYPAPSVWWDWRKTDYGVNVRLNKTAELILEYSDNQFLRGGRWESNNEWMLTLRLTLDGNL